MEILVHFSGVPVTLETNGFSGRIDIDQLTSIIMAICTVKP